MQEDYQHNRNDMKKKRSRLAEWQNRMRESPLECRKCGRTAHLTVDHTLPVMLLTDLNLADEVYEWEENFDVLCKSCNTMKSGHLDLSNPKTMPLLKKAVEMAESQLPGGPKTTQEASDITKTE